MKSEYEIEQELFELERYLENPYYFEDNNLYLKKAKNKINLPTNLKIGTKIYAKETEDSKWEEVYYIQRVEDGVFCSYFPISTAEAAYKFEEAELNIF